MTGLQMSLESEMSKKRASKLQSADRTAPRLWCAKYDKVTSREGQHWLSDTSAVINLMKDL